MFCYLISLMKGIFTVYLYVPLLVNCPTGLSLGPEDFSHRPGIPCSRRMKIHVYEWVLGTPFNCNHEESVNRIA